MLISGEPTPIVRELWEGPAWRSFDYLDGRKRARDLAVQFVPIQTPHGPRHMVYPARDQRVMRVVRKVVRGLCHHHRVLSPVADDQVWAEIQRFEVPPVFLEEMTLAHVEEDVLQYRFGVLPDPAIHSVWLLRFYSRTPFICIVYRSVEERRRIVAEVRQPGT
jgi:hypothetical protein